MSKESCEQDLVDKLHEFGILSELGTLYTLKEVSLRKIGVHTVANAVAHLNDANTEIFEVDEQHYLAAQYTTNNNLLSA